MQECVDEVLDLALAVEVVLRASRSRRRRRSDGRSRCQGVVDWEDRRRASGDGSGLLEAVSTGIDLRRSLGKDGGDGGEVAAAVEVLLYGSGDDETLDAVDDAVGAEGVVGAEDLGGVDGSMAGGLGGQMQAVIGESAVAEVVGGPVVRGDSRRENVRHQERLKRPKIARLEKESLKFRV